MWADGDVLSAFLPWPGPKWWCWASSWVPFCLRKQDPPLKAACNYSVPSQHPLFSGSEVLRDVEKLKML